MEKADIADLKNQIKQIFEQQINVVEVSSHVCQSQIPKSNTVYVVKCSVMFVDMRDSTKMTENLKEKEMTKIYKSLSKIVTYAASSNNGYIEQIQGDGYLCTFYDSRELASGGNAINAAIDILTYIDCAYNEVADCNHQIQCGIGIRTGNIYVANLVPKGENDFNAPAFPSNITNTASKMCDVADGGEILFDDMTYREIRNKEIKKNAKQLNKKAVGLCRAIKGIVWRIEQ